MKFFNFFKNHLNAVWTLGAAIIVLLTDFIIPPGIDLNTSEGEIDHAKFSKFIVCGIILVLVVPFNVYNQRKHLKIWFILCIAFLLISCGMLFKYFDIKNSTTAYDRYKVKRVVTGNTLLPIVQKAVDSLKRINNDPLSRQAILESAGSPQDIWPIEEIERNTRKLLLSYTCTFVSFSLFLLFGLQSGYCVTRKPVKK